MTLLPNLDFPGMPIGPQEKPWSLRPLLYRGGAKANRCHARELTDRGLLGKARDRRLPVLTRIHDYLLSRLIGGVSKSTLQSEIKCLRKLYSYADGVDEDITEINVERIFVRWVQSERQRVRLKLLSEISLYGVGCQLSSMLSRALDLSSDKAMRRAARLRFIKSSKKALGTQRDKQNLSDTYAMGHALIDIANELTFEKINSPLPIEMCLRTGQRWQEWSGLKPADRVRTLDPEHNRKSTIKKTQALRERWSQDTSLRVRFPLINLRIEAELQIFIAQTGMNVSQAAKVKMGDFRYQSYSGGYAVRRYKGRKGGEVEFEIFSEYRPVFERYLRWRDQVFPESRDGLLFPFLSNHGEGARQQLYCDRTKRTLEALGVPFISASLLRNTRINWLLRRSDDPELTAEQAQHAQQTLIRHYQRPHHQRAAVEATRFWQAADPSVTPPSPGKCIGTAPALASDVPATAPAPDCASAAGCLFCIHHRDIDNFDYVWSLMSFRHLKSLELSRANVAEAQTAELPSLLVVERATAKIEGFSLGGGERPAWVAEALARVTEGYYHPYWDSWIQIVEYFEWT